MYRTYPYAILFVTTALLQVFLFDNLSLSLYFDPLVYLSFIVLLPLDIAPVVLLGAGLATGVGMDMAMGTAGIN
ncbi:MAG TPA: rod shape-determining protein MreD, partial [Alistipes sp.]|nr:rod shape-determining protein MreD [Alistipes sp.]